jgi:4-carboxymuconolactone decarboxylase
MHRLEPISVSALSEPQQSLYRGITEGPRAQGPRYFELTDENGALLGPFNAFLLSPRLGGALQELGSAVRYQSSLTARIREMAILIVAARWNSNFERTAHESVARGVGLTDAVLERIREGYVPELEDEHERACMHLVAAMVAGDIDDEAWAKWAKAVDQTTIFELTTLVGYYATLALQMRVFRVD